MARFGVSLLSHGWRSALVVITSLLLTGIAWYAVRTSVNLYDSARFSSLAKEIHNDISFQMQTYIDALLQAKALFHASTLVTREDFHDYVNTTGLLRKYPGIQGLGYTARIPSSQLTRHINEIRASGFKNYDVWPDTPRAEYFSIVYLEPFDWRNQRAFGYDMYTEPARRAAMATARDSGEPTATVRVTLVQETNVAPQPGFLIYVPVYRRGAVLDTVERRQAALAGFVYSPFRAHDLFRGIFSSRAGKGLVDFEIFDGTGVSHESLLYDDDYLPHLTQPAFPRFKQTTDVSVAGRPWKLVVYSLPAFEQQGVRWLPTAVLVVGLIVTALLAAMLRASRKEFETSRRSELLLENMSDGVSVSDENGIIRYTNRAEDTMFGYAPGELIGKHVAVQNQYPPEENQRIVANVMRALREKGEWAGEFKNVRKDGTPFTTFARITALDIGGQRHFVCVQRDVTELKRAEQALHESEARFRHVADEAPMMIWMSGVDKRRYYVNQAWIEFTGRTLEQETDSGWAEGVHPEDTERCFGIYTAAFDARVSFTMEYRLRRHDGEYRWILDHGAPRFTVGREFLGYIGSCVDIHDRKRIEQTLHDAIKARDAFLSIVSHELRTPITTLKLQAQIRRKNLQAGRLSAFSEDKLAKMIDIDNRQIERLHRLVDEMLDISRISSGRFVMEPEEVDLCELTRELVERLEPQFHAAGCHVRTQCPGNVVGQWDRFRLEQVIVNLLTNAVKYGAKQPIDIDVVVNGDRAVLSVRDHGIGIATENRERIFERYERVATPGQISGLGLGLYIVRQILIAHGGSIRVESNVGEGSTFIVELPLMPSRRGDISALSTVNSRVH